MNSVSKMDGVVVRLGSKNGVKKQQDRERRGGKGEERDTPICKPSLSTWFQHAPVALRSLANGPLYSGAVHPNVFAFILSNFFFIYRLKFLYIN